MSTYCLFILLNVLLIHGSQALHRRKRVIKGSDALLGEFPYQVSIQNTDSQYHHCGGIIINEYFVLTAAHCLDKFCPEDFQIVSGTLNLNKPYSVNNVSKIYVHEDYSMDDSYFNDIALIKVQHPFIFNDLISPAMLPKEGENVQINVKAVVSGFGRKVYVEDYTSKLLQKAELTIRELDFCKKKYEKVKFHVRESQICVYESGKGICKGDSGGPLVIRSKVVGISSYANNGCADAVYPTLFTKISSYIDWIHKHTAQI